MTDQLNSVVGPIFSDLLSVVVDCMYRVARKIDHFVFYHDFETSRSICMNRGALQKRFFRTQL